MKKTLQFNNGTPDLKADIIFQAESVLVVKDDKYFYLVNAEHLKDDNINRTQRVSSEPGAESE